MNLTETAEVAADYTPWRATKFYVPLLIQAASQSLTYPLVAAIVSHGANGVVDLAAFSQGQIVMFVIIAFGGGLLTTGMVFGRDAEGFREFKRLNQLFCLTLIIFQAVVCLHPFDHVVFRLILGLAAPLDKVARDVLLYSIPMQVFIYFRNAPLVALYNARASAAVNWTTLFRIGMTLLLVPIFIRLGWTGPLMGVLAITLPIGVETGLSAWLAAPIIRGLKPARQITAGIKEQFFFNMPLSFGVVLLAISGFMVGAFIARAVEPERMLPIHYVTMGLINPVGVAALRMQAVVISFPPRHRQDHSIFWFALVSGLVLSLFSLVGQIPFVADWYFVGIQNLPRMDAPLAVQAMLLATILPVLQSLRGHAEGIAAWQKRPNAILAGQAMFLASLVCALFILLNLGVSGYLMGVIALLVAVTMTLVTIRMGLVWADMEDKFGESTRAVRNTEG